MAKYELKQDIESGRVKSAYIYLPFDEGKELLELQGYNIIGLKENAELRIQQGKDATISKYGNWVKQGSLYVLGKNNGRFITNKSPVMKYPKEATQAHRNVKEFYITKDQVEEALSDSIELSDKVLEEGIPSNRLGEDKVGFFLFGEIAKDYGLFLKDNGINIFRIFFDSKNYIKYQIQNYANQLYFECLDVYSLLYGFGRVLGNYFCVRGVLKTSEASN